MPVPSLFDITLNWLLQPNNSPFLFTALFGTAQPNLASLQQNDNSDSINPLSKSIIKSNLDKINNNNNNRQNSLQSEGQTGSKLPLNVLEQNIFRFFRLRKKNVDILLEAMGEYEDERSLDLRGAHFSWKAFLSLWKKWKGSLTSLMFDENTSGFNATLVNLMGPSTTLETLILRNCDLKDSDIFFTTKSFPNLKTLDLSFSTSVSTPEAALCNLRGLTALDLSGWEQLSDFGLKKLSENCPGLVSISLAHCRKISDAGLQFFLGTDPNSERQLFKTLRILNISSCIRLSDASLQAVGECLQLESLHMSNNNRYSDNSIGFLKNLKSLREINICYCHSLSDRSVQMITTQFPILESLHIGFNQKLTAACAQYLPTCVHLIHLFFCGYFEITNEMIANFKFKELESLNLWKCNQLTDDGFAPLLQSSPKLQKLMIGQADRISDKTLTNLSCTPSLTTLIIGGVHQFSDLGIRDLAGNCPQIETLDILSGGKVSDVGLSALAQCKKLWYLDLRMCQGITDVGIDSLCKSAYSLSFVDLGACSKISIKAVELL